MKDTKPQFAFLKSLVGLIINNWGLKILAIILAIVIYYAMKPERNTFITSREGERTRFEKTDSNGKTATP